MGVKVISPPSNKAVDYQTPLTGATITIAGSTDQLFINPAGTIAALTVNLPASPSNGKLIRICSTQAVTALTMGGGTIVAPLTTLAAGGFGSYVFSVTSNSWCRCG